MVRSRMAHGELRSIDADAAREMPGVHMIITAADLDAAGIKQHAGRRGKAPRWNAHAAPAAATARDRSRALCRRTDRHGGGGDDQAGEGRGRVDLRRHRSAAGGDNRKRRGGAGCAAVARRRSGQRLPGLSLRRQRAGRRGLRACCACHDTVAAQQPHRGLPDGTALRHRRIRSGRGSH